MGIKVTDKRNKGQSISKSRADFRNTKAKKTPMKKMPQQKKTPMKKKRK